ncbi:hypothetical protein C8J56DRAFT_1163015 [Mycena floridula]|nr:hypothetical protein C8J56DRAFT_1163015 [Mycena floridula]
MRRFTSVFGKREKSASTESSSKNLKRAHTVQVSNVPAAPSPASDSFPSTPHLSDSSAASSSGGSVSVHLKTPEPEDEEHIVKSKSWKTWLIKRSGTVKQSDLQHQPVPEWQPNAPPLLRSPPTPIRKAQQTIEVDSSSESDEDDSAASDSVPPTPRRFTETIAVTASSLAQASQTLQLWIQNSLIVPSSPSPFVQIAATSPLYPRSCNQLLSLPHRESLLSAVHKKRLLWRLRDTDRPLTAVEQDSILSLTAVPSAIPSVIPSDISMQNDEPAPSKSSNISSFSSGLRRWISRPCFEDRYTVWAVVDGTISHHPVTPSSSKFGVAALEYSQSLEAMIDFTVQVSSPLQSQEEPWISHEPESSASDIDSSPSTSSTSLSPVRTSYAATPSPLRNGHDPASPKAPLVEPIPSVVKRGVRFAEDDKEDIIPIGYALRIKQQREQKAKFLSEQRERRAFEEERAKIEAERRKRDKERMQWEKERQAWENEKKAMEEERQRRLIAAELAATRERRENQRNGGGNRTMHPSASSTSLREPERNPAESKRYSRPVYDAPSHPHPRRQASEPGPPTNASYSPHSSSPPSSRPPSIGVSSSQNQLLPPGSKSRPPSVNSMHSLSSSEDVRARGRSAKRNSVNSVSSATSRPGGVSSYATWSSSHTNLPVPPVPAFPLDMPLLPPTAPFMLHQYPRQKNNSPASSGSSSPRRLPSNHSSERLDHQSSRVHTSSSPSPASRPSLTNVDPRRSSLPSQERGRTAVSAHQTPPTSGSRGRRPPAPSSYSQPIISPWTGLPMQGNSPSAVTSYAQKNLSRDSLRLVPRRQTTIS